MLYVDCVKVRTERQLIVHLLLMIVEILKALRHIIPLYSHPVDGSVYGGDVGQRCRCRCCCHGGGLTVYLRVEKKSVQISRSFRVAPDLRKGERMV